MTRESRARALALATAVLVVLLAALFAALRNLAPATDDGAVTPEAAQTAGRDAFVALGCGACHAAAGVGNPALPLDAVGRRLDRAALRAAAFGTDEALPAPVAAIKRTRAADPRAEALLDYLQQLD